MTFYGFEQGANGNSNITYYEKIENAINAANAALESHDYSFELVDGNDVYEVEFQESGNVFYYAVWKITTSD